MTVEEISKMEAVWQKILPAILVFRIARDNWL